MSAARRGREGAAARTDAELFAETASGRLDALGALFDRHHAAVRAFLVRMARVDEVDDLVQDTFLTASRAASSFDPEAPSGRPFLLGVAAQLVRRRRRSFARVRRLLSALGSAPVGAPRSPEELTAARLDAGRLGRALEALSPERREVLMLVEAGGLSGVEAAAALGVPAGTVWRRLHEARAQLRRELGGGP